MVENVKCEITKFRFSMESIKLGMRPLSTKSFWNRINRLKNKKQQNKIPIIVENEIRLETDDDKANAFGRKLELTFSDQLCNTDHKSYVEEYVAKFMNRNLGEAVEPIAIAELKNAISKLNNKISQDDFQISNRLLKHMPPTFKLLLVRFYNDSLKSGVLPEQCKSSIITMIPKKGEKKSIKNYRPISSTPCIIKLLEKIIHNRITNFLTINNAIIKQQSGFRTHRQCKDNLIFMSKKSWSHLEIVKSLLYFLRHSICVRQGMAQGRTV